MIDPDLQKQFEIINANLDRIRKGHGIWRSFFNGMFGALGYLVGLAIILSISYWVLDKAGVLPEFKKQVRDFQAIMEQAKTVLGSSPSHSQQGNGVKGSYQITMPDGRVVNVNQ